MRLTEMIKSEMDSIENSADHRNSIPFIRDDTIAIMICALYKDGKMHYILPPKVAVMKFMDDLVNTIKSDGWEKMRKNYEDLKLKLFLDENDFKL